MIPRQLFEVLLYTGLLISAIIFVMQTIEEYRNGTTSYTITQEQISLNDLPTLTLCWGKKYFNRNTSEYEFIPNAYGKNVSIDLRAFGWGKITVTLMENKNVLVSDGLHIHLSELHMNGSVDCGYEGTQYFQCFKLIPKYDGLQIIDIKQFVIQLAVKFKPKTVTYIDSKGKPKEKAIFPTYIKFLFTSEDNTYGLAAGNRFFDGHVDSGTCSFGLSQLVGGLVKITEVSETLNIPQTCSQHSYYQCLTKHFTRLDFSMNKTINGSRCQFSKICTPFSLPFNGEVIPLCKNEIEKHCFQQALTDLIVNHGKNCKQMCLIKEFRYETDNLNSKFDYYDNYLNWINESWNWGYYDPRHSLIMEYSFSLDRKSKGAEERLMKHRSEEPYKIVRKEYLIMSGISLVGNVGGMLGLFIGFSFLGVSEWIVDGLIKVCATRWKTKKIKKKPKGLQVDAKKDANAVN